MPPFTAGRRPQPNHAALVRGGLAAIAVALLTSSAMLPAQQPANPSDVGKGTTNEGRQVSLHDQLRVGLKAYTPKDKAFLDRVVFLVDRGVLPRNLVDSTFLWARNHAVARKGRNPLRPIVYFEPALVLRARRLGIVL